MTILWQTRYFLLQQFWTNSRSNPFSNAQRIRNRLVGKITSFAWRPPTCLEPASLLAIDQRARGWRRPPPLMACQVQSAILPHKAFNFPLADLRASGLIISRRQIRSGLGPRRWQEISYFSQTGRKSMPLSKCRVIREMPPGFKIDSKERVAVLAWPSVIRNWNQNDGRSQDAQIDAQVLEQSAPFISCLSGDAVTSSAPSEIIHLVSLIRRNYTNSTLLLSLFFLK